MKRNSIIIFLALISFTFQSCEDWLNAPSPGVTKVEDFFTSGTTAIQTVNASYVPLMWEFSSTYYPEWFIGDIVSDDALKGGQYVGDNSDLKDMETFMTNTNNGILLEFYRAQYQGVARCNLALQEIPKMNTDTVMDSRLKARLIGEAKFLRAMYYFRLVRVFGGVPKIDFVVDSSKNWNRPRATAQDIYDFIIEDLLDAQKDLWKKSEYPDEELGRATKGAAQAMLLKAYLYTKDYQKAAAWGDSVINQGEYALVERYFDNFTLSGENGRESVFEIQYMEEATSDYGGDAGGNGATRGTFTVILTRGRNPLYNSGWGFNKPTESLYNEYEPLDPRRDLTIITPTDAEISNPAEEIYLGNRYLNRKYAQTDEEGNYPKLAHDARAPLNNKVIRYADVLLMYAEACCEIGQLSKAKQALDQVRARACYNDRTILPAFPNYECNLWDESAKKYVKRKCNDNQNDLKQAIRHERRVELAMEGHRWFDLCRWEIVGDVMTYYKETADDEIREDYMGDFVKGKNELFPIPSREIELSGIAQNPNY